MPWFKKTKRPRPVRPDRRGGTGGGGGPPEGLWLKCDGCREILYSRDLDAHLRVCPGCGHHFRLDAGERIRQLLDDSKPRRRFDDVRPVDPLSFRDSKPYRDRLRAYQQATGEDDAVIVVEGHLEGLPLVLAVMEYRFMGGSMGSVVGERITRAAELALTTRRPLIVVSASGGARMQSPPVIEQTIRQSLPEGFQRSEFLLAHGFLDMAVPRGELKATLATCLRHLGG